MVHFCMECTWIAYSHVNEAKNFFFSHVTLMDLTLFFTHFHIFTRIVPWTSGVPEFSSIPNSYIWSSSVPKSHKKLVDIGVPWSSDLGFMNSIPGIGIPGIPWNSWNSMEFLEFQEIHGINSGINNIPVEFQEFHGILGLIHNTTTRNW